MTGRIRGLVIWEGQQVGEGRGCGEATRQRFSSPTHLWEERTSFPGTVGEHPPKKRGEKAL